MSNSDEDSSTKQVLEYYKKYSQNPHLQKYFSGTSTTITYAPISDEETPALAINIPKIIITESSTTDISSAKKLQSLEGPSTSKGSSRSVHSSSDAIDIKESQDFVKASTLQRSNSLPSKLCSKEVHFDLSPSENVKILLFGSTSSSDESIEHAQIEKPSSESSSSAKTKSSPIPSTSSSEEENKIINFGVSLSSLKKKIGLPVAFSTPVFPVLPEPVHGENIYTTPKTSSREYIKSHQTIVLSAVDEEKISNVCCNTDSNQGNIDQERTKKSSSGDVKIEDTKMSDVSKGAIKKQKKEPIKKTDKESTQEETSVKRTNQKVVQLTMSTPLTLDCLYDKNAEEIAIQTEKLDSDSETSEPEGSSCDSFEYISSNLVSLQSSQAQCNVHKKDSSLGKSSGCSVKEMSSGSSKSQTSDSREDMDKVVDLLQVFLSSKRDKVIKNKDYIKKVIKKIMFSSESSQERSSSPSNSNNEASLPRDPVQVKSSKTNTDSTEPERIVKKQSKSNSNGDYLLQFTENERLYQIAWIDNEISHLSKLKRFLEAKNNSGSEKETKKKSSKYKILGKDEKTNKELEREYIIETDQGIPPGANVKYFIDGQKFTVAHCDDSSKVSKSSVIADITVDSKTSSTNIKVSTICSVCKQIICICKPESLGEPKNRGSLEKPESHRNKAKNEYSGKNESEFLAEDFDEKKSNSLEKAFQNCNCTHATNSKCTCPFVEKLAKHFSQSKEMFYTPRPSSSVGIQVKESVPVKICKEVQSKVDSLDKQVQYLKSLIQINEDNGKSVDKMTNEEHKNGVGDVNKCVSKKSSLKNQKNGDKMIQTNRCKCASKSVQIDYESLKRLRSDSIDKKIQTEEELVRGFGVNSTGTFRSSSKSIQIGINDPSNTNIKTEKQASKDTGGPTMFSDKMVNSG
ncbi:uncharacterized protein LOC115888624, partial [Sitophilus oryzae]|uniref:Uncharacterized protein LOC115888624 n=1 Tax=Sitophilus oryzae TaxID=7048 RepID=A0A6J2YLS8_SITOR